MDLSPDIRHGVDSFRQDNLIAFPAQILSQAGKVLNGNGHDRTLHMKEQVTHYTAMSDFTHFDAAGQAHMVDVGGKPTSHRVAIAEGRISMMAETAARIRAGDHRKGDVIGIARVAGIMAAKRTGELIPLCHPIGLTRVALELEAGPDNVRVQATCEVQGQTGVEMEALTAVSVALLTIYDMCKAVDRGMRIEGVRLLEKHGGRSGSWFAEHQGGEMK